MDTTQHTKCLIICVITLVFTACGPDLPEEVAEAYDSLPERLDFNLHVKPILSDRCFACHGNDQNKLKAGLRLDNPEDAYGPLPDSPGKFAIKPGKLSTSEVFHRMMAEDAELQMPPPNSNLFLTPNEKAILTKWIEEGAEYQPHWAFVPPPKNISPPSINNPQQNPHPIDAFIHEQLAFRGLRSSDQADKETLLRRLSFDLTGFPPSREEIMSFLKDTSEYAYERQVDRLLASSHFGERMAVDWLDLARFADTHGFLADRYRDMSPWRDWVIQAFNQNMPYDQFMTWQLAGDLLENPTREQIVATGFNRLHQQNAEDGIIDEEFRVSYVSDRTDVFGVGFLGLSLGCAKCHDHKYDPISQKNYYELYSFFNNINESGLISWEGATPVPSLLLPTQQQSQFLEHIQSQMDLETQKIEEIDNEQIEVIQSYIEKEKYKKWKLEYLPEGLIAYFDLEQLPLRNKLKPHQKGEMKRQFSDKEKAMLVPAKRGKGLKLDGDAWLDLDNLGIFKRSQPFSIALNVFVPEELENGVFFHKGYGTGIHSYRGFHLRMKDNRLELMMAHTYPDNAINEITSTDIPREEWIHLAVTYDGSSKAKGYKIFLNGEEMHTEIEIDNLYKDIIFHQLVDPIYPEPIEPGIQFGARWRGVGLKGGIIDEVMIFDRELSLLEILRLGNEDKAQQIMSKDPQALVPDEYDLITNYALVSHVPMRKERLETLHKLREVYVDSMEKVKEVMVMKEMPHPRKAYMLERGQYDMYGEEVFPNTPEYIMPMPSELPKNRLGLAKWLTHPDHPLTARVAVNRYWQLFFGRGLVKSTEDFGNQGNLPDHPALLDWLAVTFMTSGWDVKALTKLIVTSSTYKQSSRVSDDLRELDPENVWLARGPSKRLTGEMIRDQALFTSGLINPRIGGESVKPYQPKGLWKINNTTYHKDTGDKLYRRSLYVYWKRTVPNPTLATFDVPSRSECMVRRQQTNTPLQALVLMNDPAFLEAAKVIGEEMTETPNLECGIQLAFEKLSGRSPGKEEIQALLEIQAYEYQKFKRKEKKPVGLLTSGDYEVMPGIENELFFANTVLASVIMCSDAAVILR